MLSKKLSLACLMALSLSAFANPPKTKDSFLNFTNQITEPEIFFDNKEALKARLQFLEQAPAGAEVRILTFVFENGETTRRLAAHVCRAAKRGVKVKFMVDSKSGNDRSDFSFFKKPVNSEIYQYMANCGADMRIWNKMGLRQMNQRKNRFADNVEADIETIQKFRETKGKPIPRNYLRNVKIALGKMGVSSVIEGIKEIRRGVTPQQFLQNRIEERTGVDISGGEIISLMAAASGYFTETLLPTLFPREGSFVSAETSELIYDKVPGHMNEAVKLWKSDDKEQAIKELFKGIKYLSLVLKQELPPLDQLKVISDLPNHPFNRLNHRKLFHVTMPTGKNSRGQNTSRACIILGGRNLGDHYLANHQNSFLDSDIRLCSHMNRGQAFQAVYDAKGSFDELFEASSLNPWNKEAGIVERVGSDNDPFKYLWLAKDAPKPLNEFVKTSDNVLTVFLNRFKNKERRRSIVQEVKDTHYDVFAYHEVAEAKENSSAMKTNYEITHNFLEGRVSLGAALSQTPYHPSQNNGGAFERATNWRLKKSYWRTDEEAEGLDGYTLDEIRKELLNSIKRETKRIYIETAYSQFLPGETAELEKKLAEGVQVKIRTNGIYTSDGVSWLIRVHMARWVREMADKYGANGSVKKGLFEYEATAPHHNQMIHFKGATFACQRNSKGALYRSSIIGSHNFHPRSGFQDKEHALIWTQPAESNCRRGGPANIVDLEEMRDDYYAQINRKAIETIGSEAQGISGANVKLMQPYTSLLHEIDDANSSDLAKKNIFAHGPLGEFRYYLGKALLDETVEKGSNQDCSANTSYNRCIKKDLHESLDLMKHFTFLFEFLF